jgi:hypothetical protein
MIVLGVVVCGVGDNDKVSTLVRLFFAQCGTEIQLFTFEVFHSSQITGGSTCSVCLPVLEPNLTIYWFEPCVWSLTFRVLVNRAKCRFNESAGKIVIYNFRSITRNITRLLFLDISLCFIYVIYEPGFLVICRFLVRVQVKKLNSKSHNTFKNQVYYL